MTDVRNPVSGAVVLDISNKSLISGILTATTWTDIDLPSLHPTYFKAKAGWVLLTVLNNGALCTIAFRPNGSGSDFYQINTSVGLNCIDAPNGIMVHTIQELGSDGKLEYYAEANNNMDIATVGYLYNSD